MQRNVRASGGLILAERVMLALGKTIGRQAAHDLVHTAAMDAIAHGRPFADVLKASPQVTAHLAEAAIDALLDPAQYTGLASQMALRVVDKSYDSNTGN
jgi:adenylosuccinate lyase